MLANGAAQPGFRAWVNGTSLVAIAIYSLAMLLWLWVLGRVPLTQAFAFFGLSFFIVPALAHRFLGDAVSINTWVGAAVIALGIVITNWRPV
jgi:undecaprenyl phosphate-alpha-L-ara4N flippase subunit ArnE